MIILHRHDIPPGMTPQMAAALVVGPERAQHDLVVVVRHELSAPPVSQETPPFHSSAPTDSQSLDEPAPESTQPLKPALDDRTRVVLQNAAKAVAEVTHNNRTKVEGVPIQQALLVDTVRGIKYCEVSDAARALADELGFTIVPSHRGIECHRSNVRVFTVVSMQECESTLLRLKMRQLEAMLA